MRRREFVASLSILADCLANPGNAPTKQESKIETAKIEKPPMAPMVARKTWTFTEWSNKQGWTVSADLTGAVMGGTLWLSLNSADRGADLESTRGQIYGLRRNLDIESPRGIGIPATQINKVRMRILNLSPLTDGFVDWRTSEAPEKYAGPVRFAFQPNRNEWQDVVCHIDGQWRGTIDQIRIRLPRSGVRGDLWISSIELVEGPARKEPARPDVCSEHVVPRLSLPGIPMEQFADAFKVLDECLITNVPLWGFNYPFLGPGGVYGEGWWQLDSSLAVAGAKWANQSLVEGIMRGFKGVQEQNPDGRIDLYGGSAIRGQVGDVSSLPRFFEMAYDVARRTGSAFLREEIYGVMKRYLGWWLSPIKKDRATGLITATGEETVSGAVKSLSAEQKPQTDAAIDLNVAVTVGCFLTASLARALGKSGEARELQSSFEELRDAINTHLWNEQDGVYYNLTVRDGKQSRRLICTTFDPLRLQIAPASRVQRLVPKLVNPALFDWGRRPVTSIAKTEPDFVEATGPYKGLQWYGDVWAMRNAEIIAGLEDSGCHSLAAELAWSTIKAFSGNYYEYLVPSTGRGDGASRLVWTASLYIQAIIEDLFGVDYDRIKGRIRILPHIPKDLFGQEVSLRELIIPHNDNLRIGVRLKQTAPGKAEIEVQATGQLPQLELHILLPHEGSSAPRAVDGHGRKIPVMNAFADLVNACGVRVPLSASTLIRFE